ncbi:MAG TPA: DnaJ family domain-containing protein [Candidatus Binatia bacterium]
MAWTFFQRVVEERILEAQRAGAFDNLPGKGKPLQLDDQSWVPEDLRVAYHILKNAHVLPPEAELLKDIHTLEDLLKYVEDEGKRKALAKTIQNKVIRLDLLKRRTSSYDTARYYGARLVAKLTRR